MPATRIYRPPMVTTRRLPRRKLGRVHPATRRGPRPAARPRRRVYPVFRFRSIIAALRELWLKIGHKLTKSFSTQAIVGLAGIVGLVIDCVALHTVLIA